MEDADELNELVKKSEELTREVFSDINKMRDFLQTLSKMYNTSFRNVLLLKSQKQDVTYVAEREIFEANGYKIKDEEQPLKYIKPIRIYNELKFKITEVFDISQTDMEKITKNGFDKEYVDKIIQGICSKKQLNYLRNNLMYNIENILSDISTSMDNESNPYVVEQYAMRKQIEMDATKFVVAKYLNINTRNYNLKDICKWAVDKDIKTLMTSLKNIQKVSNYFVKEFNAQEKILAIENAKEQEEDEEDEFE